MLDLLLAARRVLPRGVEVQTRAAVDIVPQLDLLSRLVLGADVLGREVREAIFPAPDQGCLEAGDGGGEGPFGGAQVAQEAFAREPEAFGVAERGGGEGRLGGGGEEGPCFGGGEEGEVFGALVCGEGFGGGEGAGCGGVEDGR